MLGAFYDALIRAGFAVDQASSVPEAVEKFAKNYSDIAIVDLLVSEGDPLSLMFGILGARPHTHLIGITASGSMRQATLALKRGAFDFLVRPFETAGLLKVVTNAAEHVEKSRQNKQSGATLPPPPSAEFERIWSRLLKIAPSTVNVLLEGEDRAFRARAAHQIHTQSQKSDLPFVVHEAATLKGALMGDLMTDALFEKGGTLYFDNICDLKFDLQTELLRFLQTSVVRDHVRGNRFSQVRVICGCGPAPENAVDSGILREDLFYRLNVVRVALPERVSAVVFGTNDYTNHPFKRPGGKAFGGGNAFNLQDVAQTRSVDAFARGLVETELSLAEMEQILIEAAVESHGGSVPKAAEHLQVAPSTLYRKIQSWAKADKR